MFFKKKEKIIKPVVETIQISKEEIQEKLDTLLSECVEGSSETYDQIGECYHQLEEYDLAIDYYEKYFKEHYVLGKSYNALMSLYNIKRRQAAQAKDDAEIQKYLVKIDDHLKFSKDITRGAI